MGGPAASRERVTLWAKGISYALIVAFCFYRIRAFDPKPLDATGTLRPVLYRGFHWFVTLCDGPEGAFKVWSAACLVLLLVPAVLATLHYACRRYPVQACRRPLRVLCSGRLFFASAALCLVACRFPTLLQNEFNPDEGQFLASAHKLFHDANFFRAVDTATSGPINIFPLMLPAAAGLSPDFASSRALALAIVFLSAWLLYRSVALIAAEELARIATLLPVGTFAAFKDIELVHYSSEHVPLLLIAAAMYLSVRVLRRASAYHAPVFLLGVLSSAAFFAKMQSAPIVAAMAGVALARVYAGRKGGKPWRLALLYIAGGMPLVAWNAILCVAAGVWGDFWMSYIQANASYPAMKNAFPANSEEFVLYLLRSHEVRLFLFAVFAIGLVFLADRLVRKRAGCSVPAEAASKRAVSRNADPVRWFGFLTLASVAAALFSVYKAHHPFLHYLLFLFLPLSAAVAWMMIRQSGTPSAGPARRAAFLAVVMAAAVSCHSYLWSFQDDHVFRNVAPRIGAPEGDFIRMFAGPGDKIFVWGWTVHPYLASGRIPATRDMNVSGCFRSYNLMTSPPAYIPTPASIRVASYYENRILRDLRADPPKLFIDAVGPASWFLVRRDYYGFERFPAIDAFVKENYVFVADRYKQRYFLLRKPARQGQSGNEGRIVWSERQGTLSGRGNDPR